MGGPIVEVRNVVGLAIVFVAFGLGGGQPISTSISNGYPAGNEIGNRTKMFTPMHKVLMTQRGYIQFLRWELPVPEIEQFTFCLWVKSTNLTYPHSIFSYSKNEKDRLVRSWISPYGKTVNLEIGNVEIFAHETSIEEHRWYHICQSWDNRNGRFGLWIDGRKQIDDYSTKMAGHVVPDKGDVVLGQEYTDFDKGLEDGVEGAVHGFNLVLASAFDSPFGQFERNNLDDSANVDERATTNGYEYESSLTGVYGTRTYPRVVSGNAAFGAIPVLARTDRRTRLEDRDAATRTLGTPDAGRGTSRIRRKSHFAEGWTFDGSGGSRPGDKPVGQRLVETSFADCQQGRGSPRIGGKLMLISWTRTPVRVFGGAIVKNANNDCGEF